jgi:hypothetical protein
MKPTDEQDEEIVLLAAYLLSSGRAVMDEPPGYGSFRLVDGARRALTLLEAGGLTNPYFSAVRERLDDLVSGKIGDVDATALLDDLCQQMAHGLKSTEPPQPAAPGSPMR